MLLIFLEYLRILLDNYLPRPTGVTIIVIFSYETLVRVWELVTILSNLTNLYPECRDSKFDPVVTRGRVIHEIQTISESRY